MSYRVYFDSNHFVNFEMMDNSFKLGFIYGNIYTQEFEDTEEFVDEIDRLFCQTKIRPTMKMLEDICNCYLGTHFLEPCKVINFYDKDYVFLKDENEEQHFISIEKGPPNENRVYVCLLDYDEDDEDDVSWYQELLDFVKNDTDKMDTDE